MTTKEIIRKLGDFDRWFKPCDKCGFDPGRVGKDSHSRCWRCGNKVYRDYSDRALKITADINRV